MPKPKPVNPAMAKSRPMNLVLHNPLSARKNPPQDLSDPVNPGNAEEERGGDSSSRKQERNPSQDPIEYSQVRRQENTQNADPWQQEDREESLSSTSTRKLVREVNTKKEFHDMRISNYQYLTKVFQSLQKKLGVTACRSTFAMEAIKTNVLIWRLFMSSSMKSSHSSSAKLYREFGSLRKHELRGNSQLTQYPTEIGIGTF